MQRLTAAALVAALVVFVAVGTARAGDTPKYAVYARYASTSCLPSEIREWNSVPLETCAWSRPDGSWTKFWCTATGLDYQKFTDSTCGTPSNARDVYGPSACSPSGTEGVRHMCVASLDSYTTEFIITNDAVVNFGYVTTDQCAAATPNVPSAGFSTGWGYNSACRPAPGGGAPYRKVSCSGDGTYTTLSGCSDSTCTTGCTTDNAPLQTCVADPNAGGVFTSNFCGGYVFPPVAAPIDAPVAAPVEAPVDSNSGAAPVAAPVASVAAPVATVSDVPTANVQAPHGSGSSLLASVAFILVASLLALIL